MIHRFTANAPGVIGADNCQFIMPDGHLCGRWNHESETETCRDIFSMYNLFLDDERYPPSSYERDWIICRTVDEAKEIVERLGTPKFISFDHDLGKDKTGYDFAKWLCDFVMDSKYPTKFSFYVHSQNPIGRENIENYINGFFVKYFDENNRIENQ